MELYHAHKLWLEIDEYANRCISSGQPTSSISRSTLRGWAERCKDLEYDEITSIRAAIETDKERNDWRSRAIKWQKQHKRIITKLKHLRKQHNEIFQNDNLMSFGLDNSL
jgi:hypothetical protein